MTVEDVEHGRGSGTSPAGEWVIGLDSSDHARRALDWAVAHAPGRANRLTLLTAGHVVVDEQVAWLDEAAAHARSAASVPVTTVVEDRTASAALLDRATNADLLVVGTRGHGGFNRLVLGSTSSQCASHATTPTVVVGTRAPTPARDLTVAFDGSRHGRAALRWAVRFAGDGARVHVVGVWDATPLAVGADTFFFPEAMGLARDRFDELVDETIRSTAVAGAPTINREFRQGRPRTELQSMSRSCDLMIVGARGHGTVGSAILGSVSSWLLHHAEAPVVVVP